MGIFDKLFGGDKKAEKAASDFLKKLADAVGAEQKPQQSASKPAAADPAGEQPASPAANEEYDPWATVPEEENQYNFNGTYIEYFAHIFKEDFPEYRAECERPDGRRTVFTLYKGAVKALVVELLTENSEVKKLRKQCQNEGTPYLRFYYDHEGWWNVRTYVADRVRSALRV